jgi:hypothetical protein
MKTFQLQIFKGHPIIQDGENIILIDTGAPATIHVSNDLNFLSEDFSCTSNYMGLTASKLSEHLGMQVTTLLGTDVLSKFKILLDYQNLQVSFSKEEIPFEGAEIGISNFMGIPIIELEVNNQVLKFFLDTGAKLSYLSEDITSGYPSVGTEEDFYPGVGQFETECYEIPTSIGTNDFVVRYGNLPFMLQMTLMLGGTDGIIGFDFFNNFKVVLDINNSTLRYVK